MRRSPRRPLILKRRKLPFQQNDPPPANLSDAPDPKVAQKPATIQGIPDGVYVMDHPTMSDTQVVVVPREADLQSVIVFFTAMGKESGTEGPNKFILLNGSGDQDVGPVCQPVADDHASAAACLAEQLVKQESNTEQGYTPDDSLTNIQWLGKVSSCASEAESATQQDNSENHSETVKIQGESKVSVKQAASVRPPYSYMAMIQFAINSHPQKRMTLKEIYAWIEDHFPYFREVAKPGWKNSIRHNLSLHDMFIRETSADGKISFWTIKPEANRCLTLDQAFKPGSDPMTTPVPVSMLLLPQQHQKKMITDLRKTPVGCERKIKPLLPRTNSYLVPIQMPVPTHVYLPPCPSALVAPSCPDERRTTPRGGKRVRIAPKVALSDATNWAVYPPSEEIKVELEEPTLCTPDQCRTPRSLPKRQASSSRRKQCLVQSLQEEPVLLCPDNSFLDSGLASDVSTFHEKREVELDEPLSPDRDYSFKTPIKSSIQLNSSTPSKTPSGVLPEVTPMNKGVQNILDFSPIRTPGGPAVTPSHDYTTFSLNSTPFKDLPLFGSPREMLTSATPRESPVRFPHSSCSRELLQAGGSTQANRSVTEGLVLDTLNNSLSKILVDISFTGLEDEDLGMANISWSFLN